MKRRANRGEALRWLLNETDAPREGCIVWPFAKTKTGYGQVWTHSKLNLAHRIVCLFTHGTAPSDRPYAAHLCGNASCVNPAHLAWKSVKENMADKVGHGTMTRGEKSWHAKLTEDDVRAIRAATGLLKDVGKKFGITANSVSRIRSRTSWAWVV